MEVAPILIFVLGLLIGSFLNVCIYRIPRDGLSINSPRWSICPDCQATIKFYDNIPVLSYVLLRGRCRDCGNRISIAYPLVELITGGLFLLVYYRFGLTLGFVHGCLFVALLIPVSWIDARWYIIPNAIIAIGLLLGLGITAAVSVQQHDWYYVLEHLIGAVAGSGILLLIGILGKAILRKEAMGGGDIKLMALIGLFLGAWPHLLIVVVLSAFIGSFVGLLLIAFTERSRHHPIPYGPFLALAAVLDLFWGEAIWDGYLRFIGWV